MKHDARRRVKSGYLATSIPTIIALLSILAIAFGCGEGGPEENSADPAPVSSLSLLKADIERENPTVDDATLDELVADMTSFALWMYKQGVAQIGTDKNFLISPLSISTAFGMLWPGAKGETADEIAQMLHFRMEADRFHPAANRLDQVLASRNDYEPSEGEGEAPVLETVNDLWGLKEYPYVDGFLDLLARHYGAGMWQVDFIHAPEEARQEINAYIAQQTRDLIPELLPPGFIEQSTRLVLTNAIYFKGAWRAPFDLNRTSDGPFTAIGGNTADVQMMSDAVSGSYAALEGVEVVELSYVGNDLSMVLILPAESTFADFEAGLDAARISDIMNALAPKGGFLAMPRFKFDAKLNLLKIFEDAGFSVPFDPQFADFSGLSEIALEERLHVSGAFHRAAIAVDEEGTEAAAATAIGVGGVTSTEEKDVFNVRLDRPFLFVIRDRPTGTILFMGRMVDAAAAQS
ncbi:MAG: serpin family protein [Desulfurivibrionaceae bacterium]